MKFVQDSVIEPRLL